MSERTLLSCPTMWTAYMARRSCQAGSLRRQMTDKPFTAPETLDDVRKYIRDNEIEFLFAQFVDMHGKPNAKLVPGHPPRRPDGGRGRVRGLRRRRDRAGPARSRPGGHARRALVHAAAVEGRRGAHGLRRARGGRGVALLPAHDPAPAARARALDGVRVLRRRRARVLPGAQARGRLDRAGRSARHARPALLRHARADAQPRLRLDGGPQHHRHWAGATTPPTTRTPTGSSSRTSSSPTR